MEHKNFKMNIDTLMSDGQDAPVAGPAGDVQTKNVNAQYKAQLHRQETEQYSKKLVHQGWTASSYPDPLLPRKKPGPYGMSFPEGTVERLTSLVDGIEAAQAETKVKAV